MHWQAPFVTVVCLMATALAAEDIFVITAPPGENSTGASANIFHVSKGMADQEATIDIGLSLCGMTLDESSAKLYIFGFNTKNGEGGYITRFDLAKGFDWQPMLMPFPPMLKIYLDIPDNSGRILALNPVVQGKQYDLYEIRHRENTLKKLLPSQWPSSFRCYTQHGPFKSAIRIMVDSMGIISYYNGTQIIQSPYAMPMFMRKEIPDSVDVYGWSCFASDASVFALTARDLKSDNTYIAIYDKNAKHWKSMSIKGAATDIWANPYGFAMATVPAGIDDMERNSNNISITSYDLSQSWKMALPIPGEIIYLNKSIVVFHGDDSIYFGNKVDGTSSITISLLAKDPRLATACSAFVMKESK